MDRRWLYSKTDLIVLGQNAILLGQTGNAVIGLAHSSDLAADGVHLGGLQHASALGVNIDDVQLHGGVVLGVDDPVAGGAASGHGQTEISEVMFISVFH